MLHRLVLPLFATCLMAAADDAPAGAGAASSPEHEVEALRKQLADLSANGAAKDAAAEKQIAALKKRIDAIERKGPEASVPATLTEGIARMKAEKGLSGVEARKAAIKRWPVLSPSQRQARRG